MMNLPHEYSCQPHESLEESRAKQHQAVKLYTHLREWCVNVMFSILGHSSECHCLSGAYSQCSLKEEQVQIGFAIRCQVVPSAVRLPTNFFNFVVL
jgi:hypothetical protein